MITKTVYVTKDGKEFDNHALAEVHERVIENLSTIETFVESLHKGKQARTISANAIKEWIAFGGAESV